MRRLARAARLTVWRSVGWRVRMAAKVGYWPNLRRPRTFNEHIAVAKVQRDARLPIVSDKRRVREFVADRIGAQYLPAVYAVLRPCPYPESERRRIFHLDFAGAPGSFVVKPTHMSGRVRIVRDKASEDEAALFTTVQDWLARSYGRDKGEWWYAQVPHRVLFEELLCEEEGSLPVDYKLFCFHGRAKLLQVDFARFDGHRQLLTTLDGHRLPCMVNTFTPYDGPFRLPAKLPEMVLAAEALAEGFDFMRVDLYCIGERIVFGEMTPCPQSAMGRFTPKEWDVRLGMLFEEDVNADDILEVQADVPDRHADTQRL